MGPYLFLSFLLTCFSKRLGHWISFFGPYLDFSDFSFLLFEGHWTTFFGPYLVSVSVFRSSSLLLRKGHWKLSFGTYLPFRHRSRAFSFLLFKGHWTFSFGLYLVSCDRSGAFFRYSFERVTGLLPLDCTSFPAIVQWLSFVPPLRGSLSICFWDRPPLPEVFCFPSSLHPYDSTCEEFCKFTK